MAFTQLACRNSRFRWNLYVKRGEISTENHRPGPEQNWIRKDLKAMNVWA